jgi:MoxR-like ATPase
MTSSQGRDDFRAPPPGAVGSDGGQRPPDNSLAKWQEAEAYLADPDLEEMIRVATELRQPLLLSGAPGSGKTLAAYYAARQARVQREDLFHVQVRSTETADRLRYEFDDVRYFREARSDGAPASGPRMRPYIKEGPLWLAFERAATRKVVLLFDEIDKAPRDFPNDLLHELDVQGFWVPEIGQAMAIPQGCTNLLWVITSNGERDLPDAFLRRCVHHHIDLDEDRVRAIVERRVQSKEITLDHALVATALRRFEEIGALDELRHKPGLAELLVWLKALSLAHARREGGIADALEASRPPLLGALLKDPADTKLLGAR